MNMPAAKKITKEDILSTAFDILRFDGISMLSARKIAQKLGCSTQPVYAAYSGMGEIEKELFGLAGKVEADNINSILNSGKYSLAKSYALGYVMFAIKERNLFDYLYKDFANYEKSLFLNEHYPIVMNAICEDYGYSAETAAKLHYDFFIYAYGLATINTMGASGVDIMTEEDISDRLDTEFWALTFVYGKPPKSPYEKV